MIGLLSSRAWSDDDVLYEPPKDALQTYKSQTNTIAV